MSFKEHDDQYIRSKTLEDEEYDNGFTIPKTLMNKRRNELKRKMAFLEIGEISNSPVDVKVNVCNTKLSDKRMENECHLIS